MSSSEDSSHDHLDSPTSSDTSTGGSSSNTSTSSKKTKGTSKKSKDSKKKARKGNNKNNNNNNSNGGKTTKTAKDTFIPRKSSKATSTKTHDAPMQRRDIYFALDCEMVGIGPEAVDSALARISIVNWDNEIVLDTYVKVEEPVTDYRTFVSGITPEQIKSDSALPISEVRRLVTSTLQGKILIGHGLVNDLKVVGIHHPWCDIRDTATYAPFMRTIETRSVEEQKTLLCPRKLRDLVLEKLGKHIQIMGKAHSPVEDAIAAMDLYKAVRSEWETDMMKKVNQANKATDDRMGRMPPSFVRRAPRKLTIAEMGNMPLFPATQYPPPPLSYIPFRGLDKLCAGCPPHQSHQSHQNHYTNQALLHSRIAQGQPPVSFAPYLYHHPPQMLRHC